MMFHHRSVLALGCSLALAACGAAQQDAHPAGEEAKAAAAAEMALACTPQGDIAGRASPYDSVAIAADGLQGKLCYSRPSAKGRAIFAAEGLAPYGKLWRTGANEPTIIHLASAGTIAGLEVGPGSYSIYTIPGASEWTVIVNRSISQWGHESQYTTEVEAQEIGRATVPAEALGEAVEQFTIRAEPAGEGKADLLLEWERTRVRIPVVAKTL
jgi:hypothetical protein